VKILGKSVDSIKIGEELDVDAVLTGTIQTENGSVRVNVQLIGVDSKKPLWSDKFDIEFSDVFSLQNRVSEKLAKKLSLKLTNSEQLTLQTKYIPKADASEEFAKGLNYWNKRSSDNLPKVIEHFENAVSLDENFAVAYALLADAYSLVGYYRLSKIMPVKKAFAEAEKLADRSIEIDSETSEAYNALAMSLYKQAIKIEPNNATAHQRLAWMLT